MKEQKVHPDDIKELSDVTKLPFMFKRDLRDTYPNKIFTATQEDLEVTAYSSGTTGKPTVVGYTQKDLDNWTTSLARGLTAIGLGRGDVIQVSYGYGLFTGGLGMHYGAERIGATVLPTSVGNTERRDRADAGPRGNCHCLRPIRTCSTSGKLQKKWVSTSKRIPTQKAGILGAEPWTEGMRTRIENWLGIKAYDIYGTSELSGPMFTECTEQNGFHIWADTALVEVIDPKTGEPLEPGPKGDLTLTMLKKEALPMIRYRIGDISSVRGRHLPMRQDAPARQTDPWESRRYANYPGINVFPSQIEYALMGIPEVGQHFQIVVERTVALDDMLVRVELNKESFSDKITDLMQIRKKVEHRIKNALNVAVNVELVEPGSLPRFEGKSKKVIDKRSL